MTTMASLSTLEEWATAKAGNWKEFPSFHWSAEPENAHLWSHWGLAGRDSDTLSRSNSEVLQKILDEECGEFDELWNVEIHSHWACGYVEVLTFQAVTEEGRPTPIAEKLYEVALALEDYPILNEFHFSNLEWEEAHEALENTLGLTPDQAGEVVSWVLDQDPALAVHEVPDQDEAIAEAIQALGIGQD